MPTAIEQYVEAAAAHGSHTKDGNAGACNRAYDRVILAVKALSKLPDRGEAGLLDLVDHPDESVQAWAATHLLPLREELACKTLERVAANNGLVAFSAGITLKEWRAGRLKVPE